MKTEFSCDTTLINYQDIKRKNPPLFGGKQVEQSIERKEKLCKDNMILIIFIFYDLLP